jgi:hypothetical protein
MKVDFDLSEVFASFHLQGDSLKNRGGTGNASIYIGRLEGL